MDVRLGNKMTGIQAAEEIHKTAAIPILYITAYTPELHPDILLIDIQIPGMDGLETIHRIRIHSDAKVATTPIIAITALAMPGDRERCLAAGANEYLSKPLQLVNLISVIQEILH
jgi:CheY-like chemotaxis protein